MKGRIGMMKGRMALAWLVLVTATTAGAQTYSGTSFTLNGGGGAGGGMFMNGNGDAATFSTVDNEIDSWWGLGIKSHCCTNYSGYGTVFDARTGSIYTQGNVGIGTASPNAPLDIATSNINSSYQRNNAIVIRPAGGSAFGENGTSIYLGSMTNHGPATVAGIWSALGSGGGGGVDYDGALVLGIIPSNSLSAVPLEQMRISRLGNVGIGTALPGEKLELNGSLKLSAGSGHHIVFQDGSVQDHAWDGVLESADYAESVDVTGERGSFEPGDLIVLDSSQAGFFQKANKPYSTLISGVYSTKPGALGRQKPRSVPRDKEVPMAMVGIVPTKVSTENGPVHIGDLLVSSSTPGYAMKGTERDRMMGAVLGKAMDSLESGKGVIQALISLQ